MGVCDYSDFVQKNGQCLSMLEPCPADSETNEWSEEYADETFDSAGAEGATLVLVPIAHTRDAILKWPLSRFAAFETRKDEYSWDDWAFTNAKGYYEVLTGNEDASVWQSPTYPGHTIVNFEPNTYRAFVLGEMSPQEIPWVYYTTVFGERGWKLPQTKTEAFARIQSGDA